MSSGNTEDWDCTCLFYAILYSDSVGPRLASMVNNSVDEIRKIRNELAHNKTGMMNETEFQTSMQKIKVAFSSLKLDITRIEEIENQNDFPTKYLKDIQKELKNVRKDLEEEKKRNAEPTSFCVLPPHPSHDITDRQKEADKIYEGMQKISSEKQGETTVLYLSGNPGCGKSVMARHIGERCYDRDETTDGAKFVMTLDASTLDSLLNSYMTFAEKLNCYPDSITSITTSEDLSREEQIVQLKALAIKQIAKYSTWWIIADNVTDLQLFSKYWPQGGEKTSGEGQIIVTTQDSSFIGVSSHCAHVSLSCGMAEEDAIELLFKVSGYRDTENKNMMLKVSKALDWQPLALSSTAVYVRSVRTVNEQYTWLQCLKDLESEREKLESVYQKTSLAYKTTMTAAVNLALQREIREEIMLHAFRFLSVIASDPIHLKYVVEYVMKYMPDEDKNVVALRICSSSLVRSLVQETKEIGIHQVVYHCLQRMENSAEGTIDMFAVVSAFSLLPDMDNGDDFRVTRALVKHLKEIAEKLTEYVTKESSRESVLDGNVCNALEKSSTVLYEHFVFESCLHFFRVLLALRVSNWSVLLKAREILIVLMGTDHMKYISNISENDIHPIVSTSLESLGNTYRKLGRFQESLTYLEKDLAVKTAAYGENHPTTGVPLVNLSITYRKLGRLQESLTYLEKSLAVETAAYGENHPTTGVTLVNLSITYRQLGRLQESLTYLEKALAVETAAYGENHPTTGVTLVNLSITYRQLGRLQESLTYLEKALAVKTAAYGENHPTTGLTLENLGITYRKLGRFQESLTYHEKALAVKTATYGENHPTVGHTLNNLGIAYRKLERYDEARRCYQQALVIYKGFYDDDNPSVRTTQANLRILRNLKKVHSGEEKIKSQKRCTIL